MKLSIQQEENITTIIVLDTRLDASMAPEFKTKICEIISQGNTHIILDISEVSFMDSSSLGAMVAVLKTMGSQGVLIITGAKGVVMELFKLTRMDRVFNLAKDINEAKVSLIETTTY